MDIRFFPDVLNNVKVSTENLYSKNPSILFYSINELEIYLLNHCFENLISAVSSYPEIYLEEGLNLNETFSKISPNYLNCSNEEKEYIFNKIATPSTIAWTTYQYTIQLIQNNSDKNILKSLNSKKALLEQATRIKMNNISKAKFLGFLYG